jgi:hypothetical protein
LLGAPLYTELITLGGAVDVIKKLLKPADSNSNSWDVLQKALDTDAFISDIQGTVNIWGCRDVRKPEKPET